MPIDKTLILKLEKLAKLKLDDTERSKIGNDLGNILKMVEKLEELETEGVKPLVYMSSEINRLREDKVSDQVDRSLALKNAPKKKDKFFSVPKVVKK